MGHRVFIAGGTGYLGRPLIQELVARGHQATALARAGSARLVPAGCAVHTGDALNAATFASAVRGHDVFVQLVGVAHPAPWKAAQFRAIDQRSFEQSLLAAREAACEHFVYLSVAHPAPSMRAFQQVRIECEHRLLDSGIRATILRPWYVLGPGHRWPYVLLPFYKLAESVPGLSAGAVRLGLVTRAEMVKALVCGVERVSPGPCILGVPEIRASMIVRG